MRANRTRLSRLQRAIRQPAHMTLTCELSTGELVDGLPLDGELPAAAQSVQIYNGSLLLVDWLPADLWAVL